MVGYRCFFALGATVVLGGALALPSSHPTLYTRSRDGLNLAAKAAKKLYLGTATNADQWNDTVYYSILKDNAEFGQITAANVMKWFDTEPEPGVFTFEDGDVIADFVKKTGKKLRGHNCVWHNQLPDWVVNGTFTPSELAFVVERHCYELVHHYQGQVWDVINEALNDDGTFRSDIFYDTLNSTYIPIALRAARRADPHAKLYINDYNIEGTGAKSTALKNLIKSLKREGVPIDGVGIQCHLTVGEIPTTLQQNMEEFAALGVEVAITELDMRFLNQTANAEGLAQQRADYETVIKACNAVEKCVGVTLWDFTDKYSWIPTTPPDEGYPCPWDENLKKKPAYDGIIQGFH
ncbi:endo-beta-1,4-glucanase [Lentinus tigrinus ALCF2SS1-7]|uniref:endo-beta-1,4-glucanase n=1 Tax=Lentinus tigrinus ALCF2SS1-7 TaxID=1328758 RepID=UPI001165DB26|nr:endo-beta-1,4-glucanase [Lentinus tigrinus ALCF2SS1-7]